MVKKGKLIWAITICGLVLHYLFSAIYLQCMVQDNQLYCHIYNWLFQWFNNFHYGRYLAQKWFLSIIALPILLYWLIKYKHIISLLKSNYKPILIIFLTLFISRFLSFGGWFFHDDYRFISSYYSPPAGDIQTITYPLQQVGLIHLVVPIFKNNFVFYNSFGLLLHFLIGLVIYAISNHLQKRKEVSLLAAVFFVTASTYFQNTILISSFISDGFAVLTFVLAVYLLIEKFFPGCLLFTAIGLEIAGARNYFVALPLILLAILFIPNFIKTGKKMILFIFILILMSAFYLPVLLTHSSVTQNNLLDPKYLLILGDMFTGVIIPFLISHPVIKLLSLIWGQKSFITIIIGYLSVLLITFMMVILFLKKNYLQAKLFLIGLTIITASIFFPSMMGVRVERDIAKFVEFSNNATYPQESTHYGIYPAFGLAFLVIAIGTLVKAKHFRIIMIGLIGINIITFVEGSINWNESYVYPQRKRDSQLLKYIPRSNRTEFIYAASKRQNLDIAISNFQQIFRGDIDIRIYMDPNDLVNAVKKYNPSPDQLYFLVEDLSYNIYDYSLVIRSDRQYQSVQPLENLTKLYLSKL